MSTRVRNAITCAEELVAIRAAYWQPNATAVQDAEFRLHWSDSMYLVVARDTGVIVYATANDPGQPVHTPDTGRKKATRRKGKATPDKPTDFPEFFRRLEAAGCSVEPRRDHIHITAPNGRSMTAPARIPKDHRAVRNAMSKARRDLGVDVTR